jgi:hypothetical protein
MSNLINAVPPQAFSKMLGKEHLNEYRHGYLKKGIF